MPSICFVESLTTREQAAKYNLDFLRQLDIQINDAERDYSVQARLLVAQLEQLRTSYLQRDNKIQECFDLAFNQLLNQAEIITLILQDANIQYFKKTQNFIGWLKSQSH
ncbi:MAG: hypothetical protein HEQ35_18510 [Gloeotrichia echinulata IR180]|jgi:hypothetical protein|nr:hypothetical protein [Gloeotrichia echinulata DEX184]